MVRLITATKDRHAPQIRELFWEYLVWANAKVNEEFGVNFDIASMLEENIRNLDIYMPPSGCLLLGDIDDAPAGVACLKGLTPEIGEIKRMYVRPAFRNHGLGRALILQLVEEAARIGYRRLRLDSARFMTEAHQLYRSIGFQEINAYEGSEIPAEFQEHWIFMELVLPGKL